MGYGNPYPIVTRGYAVYMPCGIAAAQGDANAVQTFFGFGRGFGRGRGCLKRMENTCKN